VKITVNSYADFVVVCTELGTPATDDGLYRVSGSNILEAVVFPSTDVAVYLPQVPDMPSTATFTAAFAEAELVAKPFFIDG
jgi:hypothetical protein